MDSTLTDTTTPVHSRSEKIGNEKVLDIPQTPILESYDHQMQFNAIPRTTNKKSNKGKI